MAIMEKCIFVFITVCVLGKTLFKFISFHFCNLTPASLIAINVLPFMLRRCDNASCFLQAVGADQCARSGSGCRTSTVTRTSTARTWSTRLSAALTATLTAMNASSRSPTRRNTAHCKFLYCK